MEKFEKPELFNFLCNKEPDDFNSSPSDIPIGGGEDGDL